MKALRLPAHAFLLPYGFGCRPHTLLPCSCSPRRSRKARRTLFGPGTVVSRRSRFRHVSRVDMSGISQVPWRSVLYLPCPKTPAEPAEPRLDGPVGAVPDTATPKTSTRAYLEAKSRASVSAVYASRMTLPSPMQDSLPAGGLRLCRERELNPLDRCERFQDLHSILLSRT